MPTLHIGFNKTVNPFIITPKGEFAPESHAIYVSCDLNTYPELYRKYGWYIGTIKLGNIKFGSVSRKKLSEIMMEISKIVDPVINGNSEDLYFIMIERLKQISNEMTKRLSQDCISIEISECNYTGGALKSIKNKLESINECI